jgi:2-polyprenyl-3-methyl-5-hydroxy-6-metoxy-1,4-benzoquinol methylase
MDIDYETKPTNYFNGARVDFVNLLPQNPKAKILEIGCGFGVTGALALSEKRCGEFIGIEISDKAAAEAEKLLTRVIKGNVETLDLQFPDSSFDAAILSEVLEHLIDPWKVVLKIAPLIRKGGLIMASSPNISHYHVILMLLRGRWSLANSGVMDRTHMRWFTPETFKQMFEAAGFEVISFGQVAPVTWKSKVINALTFNRFKHLFIVQIRIVAQKIENTSSRVKNE